MSSTIIDFKRDMAKDISFDGMYLWFSDVKMGRVSRDCEMQCPIDKEMLDNEKFVMLGRVIGEV